MPEKETAGDCGSCGKPVKDEDAGLSCDACQRWYHTDCQNVTKEFYRMLGKHNDSTWVCNKCKPEIKSCLERAKFLTNQNKEVLDRLRHLEEKMSRLEEEKHEGNSCLLKVENLEQENREIKDKMKQLEEKMAGHQSQTKQGLTREPTEMTVNINEEAAAQRANEREEEEARLNDTTQNTDLDYILPSLSTNSSSGATQYATQRRNDPQETEEPGLGDTPQNMDLDHIPSLCITSNTPSQHSTTSNTPSQHSPTNHQQEDASTARRQQGRNDRVTENSQVNENNQETRNSQVTKNNNTRGHTQLCRYYVKGTCKKWNTGLHCPFKHPRYCEKFMQDGLGANGCRAGMQCPHFHPAICKNSWRNRECYRSACRYPHLLQTKRYRKQSTVPPRQTQTPAPPQQLHTTRGQEQVGFQEPRQTGRYEPQPPHHTQIQTPQQMHTAQREEHMRLQEVKQTGRHVMQPTYYTQTPVPPQQVYTVQREEQQGFQELKEQIRELQNQMLQNQLLHTMTMGKAQPMPYNQKMHGAGH